MLRYFFSECSGVNILAIWERKQTLDEEKHKWKKGLIIKVQFKMTIALRNLDDDQQKWWRHTQVVASEVTVKPFILTLKSKLRRVYKSRLHLRFPHCALPFWKNLRWFGYVLMETNVSTFKMRRNVENACVNGMWQLFSQSKCNVMKCLKKMLIH